MPQHYVKVQPTSYRRVRSNSYRRVSSRRKRVLGPFGLARKSTRVLRTTKRSAYKRVIKGCAKLTKKFEPWTLRINPNGLSWGKYPKPGYARVRLPPLPGRAQHRVTYPKADPKAMVRLLQKHEQIDIDYGGSLASRVAQTAFVSALMQTSTPFIGPVRDPVPNRNPRINLEQGTAVRQRMETIDDLVNEM